MSAPILYSFRRCPYAIRARMALHYAKVAIEYREILLKDKPQTMLDESPKGTVPVLVLADRVIDESIDVMQWALMHNDPDSWLVHKLDHKLIRENDGVFKQNLDRYKYHDRHPEHSQQYYLEQCFEFLQKLEASLVHTSKVNKNDQCYLLSKNISVVDVAIFPFIRQLAYVDKTTFDQLPLPKLQVWLDDFLGSDLFALVMQKRPLWQMN